MIGTATRRSAPAAILTLMLCACFARTAAATPILQFADEAFVGTSPGATVFGWEFTVSTPVVVDELGVWDRGADGLVNAHDVGLWSLDGTLLSTATVDNSSTPEPATDGQWLFTPVTPMTLAVGTYVVGATYLGNDTDLIAFEAEATTIPGITFVEARALSSSSLALPTVDRSDLDDAEFGPNVGIETPEPASFILLGSALLGGIVGRRARRGRPAANVTR